MVSFAIMLVTFAFALVAACRTARQLQAYANLFSLLFAGLAGALTPLHLLPGWAQAFAPWTPGYWGLRGLTDAVQGANPATAGLVLLAFSAVFALIGLSQFKVSDRKIYVS
jgi:ABC-2 type transport system permease protein